MKTILISGGNGKFSNALIKINKKFRILAPNKKRMNILSQNSISNFISKHKVDYFIHAAAFTTPMAKHEIELEKSISTNIIGSANVALCCLKKKNKVNLYFNKFCLPR
jgi:dTDP-4-dehydrorhamnose reductase